jgi:1-acyl-sn-glycerol-3-phosphate acyltransferase
VVIVVPHTSNWDFLVCVLSGRTGFHRIAVGAGVPILPISLEYDRRVLRLGTLFYPTNDRDADIAVLRALFTPEMARYPSAFG